MKTTHLKFALCCGTFSLALVGGLPRMYAASPWAQGEVVQQQNKLVKGTVNDALGPVIGASVVEKGNEGNGTITDLDGNFSLRVKPGATLVVSYVGYKTLEIVSGNAPLVIQMQEDSKALSEVVVTALGIKRERKALGYGLDEVKGEALTKAKETNVINSMAGRVPGLVVSQTAGGPSGSTRVILRGSTEMTGNNQPLYVIDGVPLDNTNYGSAGNAGGFDLGDGISSINPDDIENMSVLKGPAASALYGSRASHGVILITTKKANKDKLSVEYNGTLTIDTQLAKWDDIQEVYGMGSNGEYSIDATSSTNKSWGAKADGSNLVNYFDGVSRPYQIIPDNTSHFFRTGLTASNSAIISAHSGKTGLRFTFTDMRNKDIVPETNMSRDIFNLRTNTTMGKVDLDFSANYTREAVKNRPALGDSKSNVGKNLMTLATTYDQEWLKSYQDADGNYANWNGMDPYNVNPYWDIYKNFNKSLMTLATTYDQEWLKSYQDADGNYANWNGMDPYNVNPYWDIYKNFNKSKKDQFRLNGKAVWNVTKHLKLQGTVGAEMNWFMFDDFKAPTTPGYEAGRLQSSKFRNRMYNFELLALYNNSWGDFDFFKAPTTPGYEAGRLQSSKFRNRMYNFELLALYNNSWGDFDFSATLGGNLFKVNNQTSVTTAQDMQIRDVVALMSFNETSMEERSYRKQINSVFGAVNVGWKHMVYLDATLRGDQSSTLPTGNNVYVYPSFSGSFVFSELIKVGNVMPYGKLRMSWAQVGSDTDPYQLGLVYTKSKFSYPGFTIGYIDNNTLPNRDLKPTKTNSFEIGLETKFLNNRIGLDVTYYTQNSKNQIMGMASSWATGYNYRLINAGEIENKGIEIALNTRPIQMKDFSWDVNVNFSKNSNKVKSLVDDVDMFELEKAPWLNVQVAAKVGENFGSIVGPDFKRNSNGDVLIDPTTGLPQYDTNNHVLGNASWAAKVGENFGSIVGPDFKRNSNGDVLIDPTTGLPQYDTNNHVLGNASWDWTGGLSTTFTYKNLSFSALFDIKVGADL